MASCDFNGPCDCRRCREISRQVTCPACKSVHVVKIDRISEWKTDKHGITYVDFIEPVSPNRVLVCTECKFVISEAGYYDSVDVEATSYIRKRLTAIQQGRICIDCKSVEEFDFAKLSTQRVILTTKYDGLYCQYCLAEKVKLETADPSDDTRKYAFDRRSMKWVLEKVKVQCSMCGKFRWLKSENQWKTKCVACYRGLK